jgi:hypothetical protein
LIVGALLATTANGRAEPAKIEAPPACPLFGDLGRRVDERIKAIRPGVTLTQFTKAYARPALNFWDDVGSERETVFFIGVADGNAQVSDELVCRFNKSDRLLWCRRECCRSETRTISSDQYTSLKAGETRAALEARLCSPSDVEVDPKNPRRVSTYYHIDLPVGHHDEGQTVVLVFEDGALVSKKMGPYY